jgi:hypothetical protein
VSSPIKETLPDGSTQWKLENGATVTLRKLAPGVMYFAAAGSITHFIDEAAKALDAEIAKEGRITVFANLFETSRMASDVRDAWAAWSKKSQAHTLPFCLVRSKIMEMAMSLISMFSGANLKVFSDPQPFVNAMKNAAPRVKLPEIRQVA